MLAKNSIRELYVVYSFFVNELSGSFWAIIFLQSARTLQPSSFLYAIDMYVSIYE